MHPVTRARIGEFLYGLFAITCLVGLPAMMILAGLLFG
jgi:hypothetical protein